MNRAIPALFAPALYGTMTLKLRKCCTRIEGLKANSVVECRARQARVSCGATPKEAIPEGVQFLRRTGSRDPYKELVAATITLRCRIKAVNQSSTVEWLMNITDKMNQPAHFLGLIPSRRTPAAQNRFAPADAEEYVVFRGRRSAIAAATPNVAPA
jgi:hypothetical protein